MSTATITIGRNVGADPMSADAWASFIRATRAHVALSADAVYFEGTGAGIWEDTREDAWTTVVSVPDQYAAGLIADLASLAHAYGQDAIACTIGETTLAGMSLSLA